MKSIGNINLNILLDNFPNRVLEYSNYITSKNTEVSTKTDQETKNITQASTAIANHRIIIASGKENDKKHKKLNINQLNSKICDKTHINKTSNNNNKERESLNQGDKKSKSEEITEQAIPTPCIKKLLHNYSWRVNSETFG